MPKADIAAHLAPKSKSSNQSTIIFVGPKTAGDTPLVAQIIPDYWEFEQVFDAGLRKSRRPRTGERGTTKFLVNAYMPADKRTVVLSFGRMLLEKLHEIADVVETKVESAVWEISVIGSGTDITYKVKRSTTYKAIKEAEIAKLTLADLAEVEANLFSATDKIEAERAAAEANRPPIPPDQLGDTLDSKGATSPAWGA